MGLRDEGFLLEEIAQGLARTLEALCYATPLELVEAEVEIPFAGTAAGDATSVSLREFRNVSLLAKDIGPSSASDTWRIRISIAKPHAAVLRVERYDAPAAS